MRKTKPSTIITIRFYDEDIDRLKLRALRHKTSVGLYIKGFILKDLYRSNA